MVKEGEGRTRMHHFRELCLLVGRPLIVYSQSPFQDNNETKKPTCKNITTNQSNSGQAFQWFDLAWISPLPQFFPLHSIPGLLTSLHSVFLSSASESVALPVSISTSWLLLTIYNRGCLILAFMFFWPLYLLPGTFQILGASELAGSIMKIALFWRQLVLDLSLGIYYLCDLQQDQMSCSSNFRYTCKVSGRIKWDSITNK